MKKVLYIIAVLLMAGTGLMYLNNDGISTNTAEGVQDASYAPRYVENISVRDYHVTGPNNLLYKKKPCRVIAIGEQINETIDALGAKETVIFPAIYGNPYYKPEPEYEELYNSTDFKSSKKINPERVMALNPDLIVSGQCIFSNKNLKSTDFWNKRDVNTFLPLNANSPTLSVRGESLENEYEFILGLGKIFACEERAEKIVGDMKKKVSMVADKSKKLPSPRVLIIERWGNKAIVAYDNRKLAGYICEALGADVPQRPSGTVGVEYIIEENPDVLIVVKSGGDPFVEAEQVAAIPALSSLKCVRNGRVYGISLNYTYNPAIKTSQAIDKFAAMLYPEEFKDK